MKTYIGDRKRYGRTVVVRDGDEAKAHLYYLMEKPSQILFNHSPDGFEWGYGGSGPAQLALAILLDFLGDAISALRLHQAFKANVIAALPEDEWTLTGVEIAAALEMIETEVLR